MPDRVQCGEVSVLVLVYTCQVYRVIVKMLSVSSNKQNDSVFLKLGKVDLQRDLSM